MRTIGLLGGSFDPPHTGHLVAARHALEHHALDELWFVPVYVHPGAKRLASYADRVAMCELAIESFDPRVRVSRAEEEIGPCVTREVVEYLATRQPAVRWRLILGTDLLHSAPSWCGWNELVERAPPIVISRGTRTPDISATQIRAALARRAIEVAAALLPRPVLDYIQSRGLYADHAHRRAPTLSVTACRR